MDGLTNQQALLLGELLRAREYALKASIQVHMGRLRETAPPARGTFAGDTADAAEQADNEALRDQENNAVLRELRELHAIEAQRARIAVHRAGVCVDCGGAVGFARLSAQPAAARCRPCQDRYEQAHTHLSEPVALTHGSSAGK